MWGLRPYRSTDTRVALLARDGDIDSGNSLEHAEGGALHGGER